MRLVFTVLVTGMLMFAVTGCKEEDKSSTKKEVEIKTPGGTTTITTEKETKKTGDSPPDDAP